MRCSLRPSWCRARCWPSSPSCRGAWASAGGTTCRRFEYWNTPRLRALRVATPPPLQGATPVARRSRFLGVFRFLPACAAPIVSNAMVFVSLAFSWPKQNGPHQAGRCVWGAQTIRSGLRSGCRAGSGHSCATARYRCM
ncbi:MAG TPA: hypothetical protein DHV21_13365 [Curvibacter sp.]|nr:hypothetical protein [Curvibacter sp.]